MSRIPSAALFEIVHAMSKGEKKHFVFYARKGKKKSQQLELFELICAQKKFDEEKLLKSPRIKGNLAVLKRKLYDELLSSLRLYHSSGDSCLRIRAQIADAELLRQKRLFAQSLQLLKKTKQLAQESEDHTALIEIAATEDRIFSEQGDQAMKRMQEKSFDDEKKNLRILLNRRAYAELKRKMATRALRFRHIVADQQQRTFGQIMKDPLLARESKALSRQARIDFHFIHFSYAWSLGDFRKALQHAIAATAEYEKHPQLLFDEPVEYFHRLINRLNAEGRLEDTAGMNVTIGRMRQLLSHPATAGKMRHYAGNVHIFTHSAEVSSFIRQRDFTGALRSIRALDDGIKRLKLSLPPLQQQAMRYNYACVLFYAAHYRDAARMLAQLERSGYSEKTDIEYLARVMQLICRFEMKDEEYVLSALGKLQRFSDRHNQYPRFTALLVRHLSRICRSKPTSRIRKKIFRELADDLNQLRKKSAEKILYRYLYFDEWMNKKVD